MMKSTLITSFAAAALALGLAACDEQQASDTATEPMQQQGAVPPADDSTGTSPMTPSSEPPAAQPPAVEPPAEAPAGEQPGGGTTSQ